MRGHEGFDPRRGARLALVAALLGFACAAPQSGSGAAEGAGVRSDPAEIERGRRLFLGACGGYCHAAEQGASAEAPDLFDCHWLHGDSDAALFATISRGVPDTAMVGFGERLGERDIWRLIAYLRSASRCAVDSAGPAQSGSVYAITQSPIFPRR